MEKIQIEIPIEPIQEPIPVEEEPVSIIVEAPLGELFLLYET